MNNPILQSIDQAQKQLAELAAVVQREPAFNHWHFAGSADTGIVQLFPNVHESPVAQRQSQAKAIARAVGGTWSRDVADGSWRNEGGAFHVILHYVDQHGRKEQVGDISEPVVEEEKEPERDEVQPHNSLEAAAVKEAREIEKYGMPEDGL